MNPAQHQVDSITMFVVNDVVTYQFLLSLICVCVLTGGCSVEGDCAVGCQDARSRALAQGKLVLHITSVRQSEAQRITMSFC